MERGKGVGQERCGKGWGNDGVGRVVGKGGGERL